MGITMFLQMKLNPAPPDPTQEMIFDWMPLIFTFMLAGFPAGLVIYWAWNNTLSVAQQSVIMNKHGAKIELWDNIDGMFAKKTPDKAAGSLDCDEQVLRIARRRDPGPGARANWARSAATRASSSRPMPFSSAEIEAGRKLFAGRLAVRRGGRHARAAAADARASRSRSRAAPMSASRA